MNELPAPPVAPDVDCTNLDGFMLNVERLMASELVALSTHEVVAAALFLWCRAWKQRPAASLPDDDRVNAAFARLPLARFKKLKDEVLRGFVKCSDGRIYHRVLADEAKRAFERKTAFQAKRDTDKKRLQKWRQERAGNAGETRFVAEGGDRDGTGQGPKKSPDADASAPTGAPPRPVDLKKAVWETGKAFLAQRGVPEARAGPLIGRWRRDYGDPAVVDAMARADSEAASDPVSFIEGVLRNGRGRRNGAAASGKLAPGDATFAGFAIAIGEADAAERRQPAADRGPGGDSAEPLLDAERQSRGARQDRG